MEARRCRNQLPSPDSGSQSLNPASESLLVHYQVSYQNQCEKMDIEIPLLDLWDLRLQIPGIVEEIQESENGEKIPFDKNFRLEYKLSNESVKGEWNRLPGDRALRALEAEIQEHERRRRRGAKAALTIRFQPKIKSPIIIELEKPSGKRTVS